MNGKTIKRDSACLSLEDRSFRFGDGIFETLTIRDGVALFAEQHLQRLQQGLNAIHIKYQTIELKNQIKNLISINNISTGIARIIVSRGSGSQGYNPTARQPLIVLESASLPDAPRLPTTLGLSSWRRPPSQSLPSSSKTNNGLSSSLARMEAAHQQQSEMVQLSATGAVAEVSSGNIFWAINGQWYTPHLNTGAVAGITRQCLLALSPSPIAQGSYPPIWLEQADEVFICNSVWGILPVHRYRHATYATGPLTLQLTDMLKTAKQAYVRDHR